MKKNYLILIFFVFIQLTVYSQVTVTLSSCGSNAFTYFGTDGTGRNIYHDGSGSFSIQWNVSSNEWEIVQLPSSVGYSNSFASTPNPPCFNSGTWQTVTPGCGNVTDVSGDCQVSITGIEDRANESRISVYPNPSNGVFQIKGIENVHSIEIYDITGRLILESKNVSDKNTIDLSGKEKGVYWYRVMDKNNVVSQGKLSVI